MFNPVELSFKIQQATLESAAASTRMMAQNYLRFIEQQSSFFQHSSSEHRDEAKPAPARHARSQPPHNRSAIKKAQRGRKSPCAGANLHDHYGKRARDVDVDTI